MFAIASWMSFVDPHADGGEHRSAERRRLAHRDCLDFARKALISYWPES